MFTCGLKKFFEFFLKLKIPKWLEKILTFFPPSLKYYGQLINKQK